MVKFNADSLVHRVIIKPLVETQTKSGIVIAQDERTQAVNTDRGTIMAFGPRAWKDFGCDTPPVNIGDKVYYAKYGAKTIKPEGSSEFFVLCNDEDVLVGYTDE